MGFIIPSDEVARLINAKKTVLRYLTGSYHDHRNNVTHIHAIKRLSSNITFSLNWFKGISRYYPSPHVTWEGYGS